MMRTAITVKITFDDFVPVADMYKVITDMIGSANRIDLDAVISTVDIKLDNCLEGVQ